MKGFKSKGYKYFVDHYPMTHNNMFRNYYKKLRQKYKYFVTYDMPFQKPIWVNGNIEEIFEYIKNSGSTSVTIQSNQCKNPFIEPVEYVYYDTGDWQSLQKIYGNYKEKIRMDYNTNEMYFCHFENNRGSFSCNKDIFDNQPSFLLFIGHYQYDIREGKCQKCKHVWNNKWFETEKEDHDRIHKFANSMKGKKYNGMFDKIADRLLEIF